MSSVPYVEREARKKGPRGCSVALPYDGPAAQGGTEDSSRKGDSKGLSSDRCPGILRHCIPPPNHTGSWWKSGKQDPARTGVLRTKTGPGRQVLLSRGGSVWIVGGTGCPKGRRPSIKIKARNPSQRIKWKFIVEAKNQTRDAGDEEYSNRWTLRNSQSRLKASKSMPTGSLRAFEETEVECL